jgi:hypothetical protein
MENAKSEDSNEIAEGDQKKNTCLLICIILILVLMLPSSLALLAIF